MSAAEESRDVLTRRGPEPDRVLRYGYADHQVVDVHLPVAPGLDHPAVVLVHGGFWRAAYDRTHLRPLAAALTAAGHTVVLPEYARVGMPDGTWPQPGQDLLRAVREVLRDRDLPHRVVLAGHSAGGHLAVWLLHQRLSAGLEGAVSLAGCLDLHLTADLGLGQGAAAELMGGLPAAHAEAYAAADPTRLGRPPVPVRALHGTADTVVPVEVSRAWWDVAADHGRDQLVELPGCGHMDLVDPEHKAFAVLREHLAALTGAPA